MRDSAVLSRSDILEFLEIIYTESSKQLENLQALKNKTHLLVADKKSLSVVKKQLQYEHLVTVSLAASYYSEESKSTRIPNTLEDLMRTVSILEAEEMEEISKRISAIRAYDTQGSLQSMIEAWLPLMVNAKDEYAKFPKPIGYVKTFNADQKKNVENIVSKWEGALGRLQAFRDAFSKLEEVIEEVEEESGHSNPKREKVVADDIKEESEDPNRPVTPQNQSTSSAFSTSNVAGSSPNTFSSGRASTSMRRRISDTYFASTQLTSPSSNVSDSPLLQENERLHARLREKIEEIQKLSRELQGFEGRAEKMPILEGTISKLEKEISTQEQEIADLNKRIKEYLKEIQSLNRSLLISRQELKKEESDYNQTLKNQAQLIKQYQDQLDRKKQEFLNLKKEKDTLVNEGKELKGLNENLHRKMDAINGKLRSAMPQLSEVQGGDNANQTFLAFLPKIREISSAVQQIPSLQKKLDKSYETCKTLEARLKALSFPRASTKDRDKEGIASEANFDITMLENSSPTFSDGLALSTSLPHDSAEQATQQWRRFAALEKSLLRLEDRCNTIQAKTEALEDSKQQAAKQSRLLDDLVTPRFYGFITAFSSLRKEWTALTQSKNSHFPTSSEFSFYPKLADLIGELEEQLIGFCTHVDGTQRRLNDVENRISQESGRFLSVEACLFRLETLTYEFERRLRSIEDSQPLNQLKERLNWLVANLPRCFHGVVSQVYHKLEAEFRKLEASEYYKEAQLYPCQELLHTLKQHLPLEVSVTAREPYVALPWLSKEKTGKSGYIPFSFFKQKATFEWGDHKLKVTPQPSASSKEKVQLDLYKVSSKAYDQISDALPKEAYKVDNDLILELVQLILSHAMPDSILKISIKGDVAYSSALIVYLKAMQTVLTTPLNFQIEADIFEEPIQAKVMKQEEAIALEQIKNRFFGPVSSLSHNEVARRDPKRQDNILSCPMT